MATKEPRSAVNLGDMNAADEAAFAAMASDTAALEPAAPVAPAAAPVVVAESESSLPEPTPDPIRAAPEPKVAVTPAAPAVAAPAEPAVKPPEKYVPVEALQETRADLKETKKELAALKDAIIARVNAQAPAAPAAPAQPAPQFQEVPDEVKDPVGALAAIKHNFQLLKKQNDDLASGVNSQQQVNTQTRAYEQVIGKAVADQTTFLAKQPDYWKAVNHLLASRREELGELETDGDITFRQENGQMVTTTKEQRIEGRITQERYAIAQQAANTGRNAAELVYKLAQKRGYKPEAAAAVVAVAGAAAPAAEVIAVTPEAQRIAAASAAQSANKGLGGAAAAAPARKPIAERVVEMSDADFSTYLDKLTPKQQRELLGA